MTVTIRRRIAVGRTERYSGATVAKSERWKFEKWSDVSEIFARILTKTTPRFILDLEGERRLNLLCFIVRQAHLASSRKRQYCGGRSIRWFSVNLLDSFPQCFNVRFRVPQKYLVASKASHLAGLGKRHAGVHRSTAPRISKFMERQPWRADCDAQLL